MRDHTLSMLPYFAQSIYLPFSRFVNTALIFVCLFGTYSSLVVPSFGARVALF
jgi:hypothetical protein